MNAARNRVGLLTGWGILLAVLLAVAAALFAQGNQEKEKEKEHKNPPAKGQPVHENQPQAHPANQPGNTAPGGGHHPGGPAGGAAGTPQNNHPATPGSRNGA